MNVTLGNVVDFFNEFPHLIEDILVNTRNGYKPIQYADLTAIDSNIIKISLGTKFIETSPEHLLWVNGKWTKVQNIKTGDVIETIDGEEIVEKIEPLSFTEDLFDIQVDGMEFYANGIVSHNSTFAEAVSFGLYGLPLREINKPQLVNSTNGSDCIVEVEFDTNGKEYKVKRGLKPGIFEIYDNGKLIPQDSRKGDYQEFLTQHILKMNHKTFTQIVIVANNNHTAFMSLKPSERRKIVENLLDIDIFSKMNHILKDRISTTKGDIADVNYRCDLSKERLKIHSDILKTSTDSIDGKLALNLDEIDNNKEAIKQKQREIDAINFEIANIKTDNSALNKMKSKLAKVTEYHHTFKTKLSDLKKEISFYSDNDNCPSCHQRIETDFKNNVLLEKQEEEKKLSQALEMSTGELSKIQRNLEQFMSELDAISSKRNDITRVQYEIENIESLISRILQDNESLLKEKNADLKKIETEWNELQTEYQSLSQQRENLIKTQHLQSIAALLLKDDGIKSKIIKHYLPTMNKLINKYLQNMDFYVNFEIDENFEEIVRNTNKENFTYHSFSAGEKLRIDLSILFTWREIAKLKNSASTNLLILDEVFDSSLDSAGVEDFVRILNMLGNKDSNIFVISHRSESISDKFDRTIQFDKVNGFSKMVIFD